MNKKLLSLLSAALIISSFADVTHAKTDEYSEHKIYKKKNKKYRRDKDCDVFDFVIVGLGTSGAVLANRLTEDPNVTVCVLEAGDDYTRQTNPTLPDNNDDTPFPTATNDETFWPMVVRKGFFTYLDSFEKGFQSFDFNPKFNSAEDSRGIWYPRGAGWGGSTLHALIYLRGDLDVYNEWAAEGNTLWDADTVLEYFKKAENRTQTNSNGTQYFNESPVGPHSGFAYNLDPAVHGLNGPVDLVLSNYIDPLLLGLLTVGSQLPNGFATNPVLRDPDSLEWDSEAIVFPTPLSHQDQLGTEFLQRNQYNDAGAPYPPNAQFGVANQITDFQRVTSSSAYIYPIEKTRKNLTIKSNSLVTKVIFDKKRKRAKGVEYLKGGNIFATGRNRNTNLAGFGGTPNDARCNAEKAKAKGTRLIKARKSVILCGGTYNSPHLLLLSGVGPCDHLKKHGIKVVKDLPGVGQHLKDHPELDVFWATEQPLDPFALEAGALGFYWVFPTVRAKSDPARSSYNFHMHTFPGATFANDGGGVLGFINGKINIQRVGPPTYWHNLNNMEQTLPAELNYQNVCWGLIEFQRDSRSEGFVRLRSADPTEYPEIVMNYFEDEADVDAFVSVFQNAYMPLIEGLKDFKFQQAFDEINGKQVPVTVPSDQSLFSDWIWPSEDQFKTDGEFDREKFVSFLKKYNWGQHASGTCKMGPKTDELAVVDQRCRVHGVKGLRVIDSSISPVIPAANTQANAYMVGERASDLIKEDFKMCK